VKVCSSEYLLRVAIVEVAVKIRVARFIFQKQPTILQKKPNTQSKKAKKESNLHLTKPHLFNNLPPHNKIHLKIHLVYSQRLHKTQLIQNYV